LVEKPSEYAEVRAQALQELFPALGYYEELQKAINCGNSEWVKTIAKKQYAQLHTPQSQARFILGLGQLFPDHFAEDSWYKSRLELVANAAKQLAVQQNHVRAHKSAVGSTSRAKRDGDKRAKIVARLLKELNALRPQMQVPEDDYPKLRRENPKYLVFKICKKRASAGSWVNSCPRDEASIA
jgi:hypothetical protein